MPDQALSKIHHLAGFKFPAVQQTLQHFLDLSLQTQQIDTLTAAIELDPAILAVFLSASKPRNLKDWQQNIDIEQYKQVALTLSNQFSTREHSAISDQYFTSRWRRSVLQSIICAALAKRVGADVTTFRLLGLLAGCGHHVLALTHGEDYIRMIGEAPGPEYLTQAEQDRYGCSGDTLGAELLSSWINSNQYSDAVKYQYVDLEELEDATLAVKLVAYSGRLTDLALKPEALNPGLFATGSILFDLEDGAVGHILAQARITQTQTLDCLEQSVSSSLGFNQTLANANISTGLSQSVLNRSISETANLIFGIDSTLMFEARGEFLVALCEDGETLQVDSESKRSQVALCYRHNNLITAEEDALTSVIDKQLLDRLGTSAIWFLPLGAEHGVLICGVDNVNGQITQALLEAFRLALIQRLENKAADIPMINAEFVRQRVNEVTHEVNNPLAIVQNYLRTLSLKLDQDSPVQVDIETISRELMRVAGIVKKYSQIGRQEDLFTEEVNVNDILTELVGVFVGGNTGIQFIANLDRGMPLVAISPDSLKQVLVNILKNAAEALSDECDAVISITSHGSINLGGEQYIEIMINDNGPGIALPIRDKLFTADNSSKGQGHSGLGLSIVKQLVAEMGGLISCKSLVAAEGEPGTSFQILLPLIKIKE